MRYIHERLKVFISSTSDLAAYRDAVEVVLLDLDIDGVRFEAWPSTPQHPIDKCLEEVRLSDAMVLILGDRYGAIAHGGLSVTHLEYKEAKNCSPRKPVFVYVLPPVSREADQRKLVQEVEQSNFRTCRSISNPSELAQEVRESFLSEFARCFRNVWDKPKQTTYQLPVVPNADLLHASLPVSLEDTRPFLADLYRKGDDILIHELRDPLIRRFGDDPDVMNFLYMTTVNLAMDGYEILAQELQTAVSFWDSEAAVRSYAASSRYYNQGNALAALGQRSAAIGKFKLALEADETCAQCWKNLGSEYEADDRIDDAEACYREALEHDPKLFEANLALGQLLVRHRHDLQGALATFDAIAIGTLSSKQGSIVEGWKAYAHLKLGQYSKAISHVEQAIKANPSAEWTWSQGGQVYGLARRADAVFLQHSLEFFQRFTTKFPDNPEAWAELGYASWIVHQRTLTQESINAVCTSFHKALELGFEADAVFWDRLGHAHQERGELDLAEKAFRKAYEKDESYAYCLGVCLITQGKYQEALPLVLRDAKSIHRDMRSWFQVALCYANTGRPDQAEVAYIRAIHLNPDYAHAWYNLGGLYWNEGNLRKAIRIWKRALRKFPNFDRAKEVRDVLSKLGR